MLSLEKLLAGLDVRVDPFALCEVRGDGRLDMGRRDQPTIHYTLAGTGRFKVGDDPPILIAPHTVLIVPAGRAHGLEANGEAMPLTNPLPRCAPLDDGWRRIRHGVGATGVLVACGTLGATYRGVHGLFDYLPEPIVETLESGNPIRATIDLLLCELAAPQPGTRAMARALMQQCLVLLLRRHCDSGECRVAWLAALDDPRLGRAVAAIFERPEAPHTLDRLAALAGMSRSAFADHFAASFGRGPIDLVREVRLRRAARLLDSTDCPIKALAARVGYASRSYFSRAFKEQFGLSPAGYRAARATEDDRALISTRP